MARPANIDANAKDKTMWKIMVMCYPVPLIKEICCHLKQWAGTFSGSRGDWTVLHLTKKGAKDKVKWRLERATRKTRVWNGRIQMRVEAGSKI